MAYHQPLLLLTLLFCQLHLLTHVLLLLLLSLLLLHHLLLEERLVMTGDIPVSGRLGRKWPVPYHNLRYN